MGLNMKRIYRGVLIALGVMVLSWFLPWLYSMVFPSGVSDPFVAWSPVSDCFIVSDNSAEGKTRICSVDALGRPVREYTKEERDSLLPQIYFNQLMARETLPDSLKGKEVTIAGLKHGQWVFSSLPRDINRVMPEVYLIMESMPPRLDLEDASEVFTLHDRVEFTDMATNRVNRRRSQRFDEVFRERGFEYPLHSWSANVTTRKPRDEGYLLVDASGTAFHMKMQAGRPYMERIPGPGSVEFDRVFVMENPETRHLGLMTDTEGRMYVLEREGYRLTELPVGRVDPRRERISVVKNLFNWVVKLSDGGRARWYALDSDDYSLLGAYELSYGVSGARRVAAWLFPFRLTFTDTADCLASPRIINVSARALYLNVVLAAALAFIMAGRRERRATVASCSALTLIFGMFSFIPMALIKD